MDRTADGVGEPLRGATLIAGPTASGKSALAIEQAVARGGVVINADSMQVYSTLRVVTARPGDDETTRVRHLLYGHVHPGQDYSTGAWLRDVEALIKSGGLEGRPAVFVGGTGLYFKALTEGLSEMPDIAPDVREHWRGRLAAQGAPVLHAELLLRDPEVAMRLQPADGQRIARALEVLDASGVSIRDWQGRRSRPLVEIATANAIVIEPDREELGRRIEARFRGMLEQGALDEVRALLALGLDATRPAMKAIGVPELAALLRGRLSVEDAAEQAVASTRRYAKRQSTWFRTQLGPEWRRLGPASGS